MKISYLGPEYTFTEEAAEEFAKDLSVKKEDLTEEHTVEDVVQNLISNKADRGVMAYWSSDAGFVQRNLDLIYENGLCIVGLKSVPVEFSAGTSGSGNQDVIYSHQKGLEQASNWLWRKHPSAEKVETASTAEAARHVADIGSGIAIASPRALEAYGLDVIEEDIGNKKNGEPHFTEFYLVSRENENAGGSIENYLTMMAITPHHDEPGLLADILNVVAEYRLNSAKIHSRPALYNSLNEDYGQSIGPQMFYLEVEAHQSDKDFEECVDHLRYNLGKDSPERQRNLSLLRGELSTIRGMLFRRINKPLSLNSPGKKRHHCLISWALGVRTHTF